MPIRLKRGAKHDDKAPRPSKDGGRVIGPWEAQSILAEVFDDIAALAAPSEIARITPQAKLPVMRSQWYWVDRPQDGSTMTRMNGWAQIEYFEHGRSDVSRKIVTTDTSMLQTIDFGADVLGGTLRLGATIFFVRPNGTTGTSSPGVNSWTIRADNPPKVEVRALLPTIEQQVLAYKESRLRQFDNAGTPMFGPPNGFGIMQLDKPRRPTAAQLWNWRENVSEGLSLFAQKKLEVANHFKNVYTANPTAPRLTPVQLKLAVYQYYNGGFYWSWNATSASWETYGTTAYGDDAIRIENMVQSGHPPPDWT